MRKRRLQVQHGDVLLQQVAAIPSGAKLMPHTNPVIVARGERTGHRHVIESDQASVWVLTRDAVPQLYLELKAAVTITHDEHKPLAIPRGIYRVGRVREYDHLAPIERRVIDVTD